MAFTFCACGADDVSDQVANIAQADDEHVTGVKEGSPDSYPNKTYGESFDDFFANPTWKYFVGTKDGPDEDGDGKPDYTEDNVDIVEFTGYCTYQDVKVKALIQFTLNKEDDTFSATYLSFNDVPQNMFMISALLSKVFEGDEVDESSLELESEVIPNDDMPFEEDNPEEFVEFDYASLDYAGWYEGLEGYSISFSAYSSVEGEEIGVAEIYYEGELIECQSVYMCYDRDSWSDREYDQLYVMHMDGYNEYLGFYQQDGEIMLDYNEFTKNYDTLQMIEHYES